MKIGRNNIKAAIFDVDGTLLDSMGIWDDAGKQYLKSVGVQPKPGLSEILFTMTIEEAAAYLKKEYRLTQSEQQIRRGALDILRDFYYYEAPLKERAKELLEELHCRNIPMAAATSSERGYVEAAFARLGILNYFARIYTCTEVGAGKQNPLIYQMACRFLDAKPQETAVFEDALYAVKTAKEAGFYTVAVFDAANAQDAEEIREISDVYVEQLSSLILYL